MLEGRLTKWVVRVAVAATVGFVSLSISQADGRSFPCDEVFPVEAILSAPFPVEIEAAPSGGRVAFVLNDKGVRNIWIADPPRYRARRITPYTEDDGINVRELRFTPDASRIVYVRGAAPNRAGEFPNPRSFPGGTERALWVIDLDGGEARRIDEGSGAAVHPSGERVAYVKKGEIWIAALAGEMNPVRLAKLRGTTSRLRWSPDGSRLAFRSDRRTHSFIGIWEGELPEGGARKDDARGAVRWLDPSVDRDTEPVWSPDGERVAFIRLPAMHLDQFPFTRDRIGEPWSVRVVDVDSERAAEIWRARDGVGSVYRPVVARRQLFWAADDRLVFPWEGDGWNHLYSVPARGGEAVLLTPGGFEVEHVAIGEGGRHIYYSSNQDDIDRRHIWRVAAAGGPAEAVTRGDGIEWSPAPTSSEGTVAFFRSDARHPARAAVVGPVGTVHDLAAETIPEDFPVERMVEPVPVKITATDGIEVPAQLFLPRDLKPGERRPAAIFLHGGSRRQMLLGWHYMGYYHKTYGVSQYLVSRGFIALALNFRSGIGYGMEFREAADYGAMGNSEFRDVIGAGLYLKGRPDVDPDRIAVWGGSYGGYLTGHALAQASDLFAAGVDLHGVHDWNASIHNFAPHYDPLDHPEEARLAWESSPLYYVDGWRSPVLLIHGDDDRNVNFTQTLRLVRELRRLEVEHEQLVFPDEVHSFLLHENWVEAYRATVDFLVRKLGR